MQRVHFIAIGGTQMSNFAIAVSKKKSFQVTGSDIEFTDAAYAQLQENKLLPEEIGWFPERIFKGLLAVVLGVNVTTENPEFVRAKELGIKTFTIPEYLFQQTRSKTRIVVSGSYGKKTIVAMMLFVLNKLRIETDYMVSENVNDLNCLFRLSYDSRIAVLEGDEYNTSMLNSQPQFHFYKPHIAVITGISRKKSMLFPNFENYCEQFREFIDKMEVQGRLIYFDGDENLNNFVENLRRDIVPFAYNTPVYKVVKEITVLETKNGEVNLKFGGEFNLQCLEAARLACRQIGVTDVQFYFLISEFEIPKETALN